MPIKDEVQERMQREGGPAFPTTKPLDGWGDPNQGMSLRDWFAGQALAGLTGTPGALGVNQITVVDACYSMADAMLKARTNG